MTIREVTDRDEFGVWYVDRDDTGRVVCEGRGLCWLPAEPKRAPVAGSQGRLFGV